MAKRLKFTYAEANERYTERYTHTDETRNPRTGKVEFTTYRPLSVCCSYELDAIFAHFDTWDEVLEAMRDRIGQPRPREKTSFTNLPRQA